MAQKKPVQNSESLMEFKNALRSGTFHTLYIFCGEESYLREYYLTQLTQKLSGPADDFNFHRFTSETLTPQELANAVEAMPMMADKTFVRVDDVDFFALAEDERKAYAEILSDIPDYCCVALHFDAVSYKPNAKAKEISDVFKTKAIILDYHKQSERELAAWVCRRFKTGGKEIPDALCRYLIFATDGMMTVLGSEIEKVISYSAGAHITREDVDAVVIPALNAQSFDISNAIADGNYDLALSKLQTLFAMQEEPIKILGAVSAQIRKLQYAKIITSCGKGQETLIALTGMASYAAGITMTAARQVSDRFLKAATALCLQTDLDMKSTGNDQKQLLELLLAAMAAEAHRG